MIHVPVPLIKSNEFIFVAVVSAVINNFIFPFTKFTGPICNGYIQYIFAALAQTRNTLPKVACHGCNNV